MDDVVVRRSLISFARGRQQCTCSLLKAKFHYAS